MSKKSFSASVVYTVLGLVFIAVIAARTISTPHLWTHLAQGRDNGPISYVEPERVINTTHLYDDLIYGLWNAGGAPLLILFNTIALLGAFILLLRVSAKWGGPLSQGFALLVAGHLIFLGVDVDPKTLMMLFIAAFVFVLSSFRSTAVLFGALIPLQILWTNMHDSFVFGPVIALLSTIEAAGAARKVSRKKRQGIAPRTLGMLTLALLASTLVNPYLFRLYGQVAANLTQPNLFYWGSPFREYFQAPTHDPLIFFVLILGAGGLITLKKQLPIMLTTLAIIGAFLIVRSVYAAQLFVALAFPFLVLSFTAVGEYLNGSFRTMLGKQSALLHPALAVVFVLLIVLSLFPIVSNCAYARMGSASRFGLGIEEQLFPSAAGTVISDPVFRNARALNLQSDGGYLAFKYGRRIFVDYRPGHYDRALLEQLNAMLLGNDEAYDALYEAYRPDAVILNALDPLTAAGMKKLLERGTWKLAYFDGITLILMLDREEFAPLLSNTAAQQAGLARIEGARRAYAAKTEAGCRAGIPAELIGAGRVYLALNRPSEAEALFAAVLQGNKNIAGAWLGLGRSRLMSQKYAAAADALAIAVRLAPDNLYAWAHYAKACEHAGRSAEKARAVERMNTLAEKQKKHNE